MYGLSQRGRWENLRSLAFGSISGVYAAVGSELANPARIIRFVNETDVNLTVSTNGIDDKEIVTAGGFVLYDFTTNRTDANNGLFIDEGTQFYVKGSPTLGTFYIVVIYASSN